MNKEKTSKVLDYFEELFPDAHCELNHQNVFELLVAVMLSAQTTDKKVNQVTASLFKKYPTVESFALASLEDLQDDIKIIGLYRNKAKNLIMMVHQLKENFGGEVPKTMEGITSLAGAGRKTANVVLSNAFGVPSIAVDTHVFRVTNRIGIVNEKNVEKTEFALMDVIPKNRWSHSHHLFIFHGRRMCKARKPECDACPIKDDCDYYNNLQK